MTPNRVTQTESSGFRDSSDGMASAHGRLGQQVLAVLDVALRVPSIFIIDAIFNSNSDPGSVFLRASGESGPPVRPLCRVSGSVLSHFYGHVTENKH